MAFVSSASSRFIADQSSAIFLLFKRSSAVFFSNSSFYLADLALYSSIRVQVRLPPDSWPFVVLDGIIMLFLVSSSCNASFFIISWSLQFCISSESASLVTPFFFISSSCAFNSLNSFSLRASLSFRSLSSADETLAEPLTDYCANILRPQMPAAFKTELRLCNWFSTAFASITSLRLSGTGMLFCFSSVQYSATSVCRLVT